jgi:hypothetical protein
MNAKALLAIATVATLAGAAARADDITIDTTPFQSTRTRAEVQAELSHFQRSGVSPWSIRYDQIAHLKSTKTRSQVQAEFLADRDEAAAMTAEDSGSAYLSKVAAGRAHRTSNEMLAGAPGNGDSR